MAERVPWSGSKIQGSPEKPHPYALERVFPSINLQNPVDFEYSPLLKRWFVALQGGKIFSFKPLEANQTPSLVMDLAPLAGEGGALYAITLDPGFSTNRFLYACYVLAGEKPDGTHISRFRVSDTEPPTIDPKSESLIITWVSGGHNGCALKFGLDGYLYISTGDAAGPNPPDPLNTGQDLGDLMSSILRIDVHGKEKGRNYRVPPDNPFVNEPGARPEIWAYGFRNPWRMSIDPKTGDLWVADVGWELWELVYKIEKGGNYGWSIMEGRQPVNPNGKRGPTPILPPLKDHPHHESSSITGGVVYYGKKYPELTGAYVYGDYDTGKLWALRSEKTRLISCDEIADSSLRIVGFAVDEEGEVYALDHQGGGIYRLERNPEPDTSRDFPKRLSETGLLSHVAGQKFSPGIEPFEIRAAMWLDHAQGKRHLALPGDSTMDLRDGFRFPTNAVLVKTLSLEMERGNKASARPIETQLLHYNGSSWQAYSFRWIEGGSDAELVPVQGAEELLRVKDSSEPGGWREQRWRFHSRAECLRCHNPWSGNTLSFNLEQLRPESFQHLVQSGLITNTIKTNPPALADPGDGSLDLSARARSYLHVNCAHCHRRHAGGSVPAELNFDLPLDKMNLVNVRPLMGDFGLKNARVIAPGAPFSSALLFRVSSSGSSRMPRIGSSLVDEEGIRLMRDWIHSMGTGAATNEFAQSLAAAQPDGAAIAKRVNGTSSALELAHALNDAARPPGIKQQIATEVIKNTNPLVRELFDRFLPAESRIVRSQSAPTVEEILALKGNAERGRSIFGDEARTSCAQCHELKGMGRPFGPNLAVTTSKMTRRELLDHIITPSKQISPDFVMHIAELADEEQYSGIIIRKTPEEIVLRDAALNEVKLPAAKVKSLKPQAFSAMPEGLLNGLTAQEAADLLEFISSAATRSQF